MLPPRPQPLIRTLGASIALILASASLASASDIERDIASIRKRYYAVQNGATNYIEDERDLCENPDQHWTCTKFKAWLDGDRIVKLEYGGGEEGYWSSTELYLDPRGKVYFIFARSENGRQDPSEIDETRTYVKGGEIIRNICRSGTSDDIESKPQTPCDAGRFGIRFQVEQLDRYREASGYR
jgi:hypothetical protein